MPELFSIIPDRPGYDGTWTASGRSILDRAIDRHGGWDAWRAFEAVTIRSTVARGKLAKLKGAGRTFPPTKGIILYPHAPKAVLMDYPTPCHNTVFDVGTIAEHDASGNEIYRTEDGRGLFSGRKKLGTWSPHQAAFFFGYVLTAYLSFPFTLASTSLVREGRQVVDGVACDALDVTFPIGALVHTRRQRFYFDETGLIRRMDYKSDVVGPIPVCHFPDRWAEAGGVLVAGRR